MRLSPISGLCLTLGLCTFATATLASPQAFKSARSMAMGGTGVASATPASANGINPALLASRQHEWADDFGLFIPSFGGRFADEEEVIDQIDGIQDTIDEFDDLRSFDEAAAEDAAGRIKNQLTELNRDVVRIDLGLGASAAFPDYEGLAMGLHTNASLRTTVRGDLGENDESFLASIENGTIEQDLETIDLGETLDSRGRILAAAVAEVGVSFARSLDLETGHRIQLGITPKFVTMHTFQYTEGIESFDDDEFDDSQYETSKSGVNVDIGAAAAFGEEEQWNAGVALRNLIPMELKSAAARPLLGEEQRTFNLDPQLTLGIAHSGEFHVVTADLELTRTRAFGFGDDTQWLSLGGEFDAFRFAQLRLGARHNLASNNNQGIAEETQMTFGLGLSPFGARLDIAGLVSDADLGAAIELGAAF